MNEIWHYSGADGLAPELFKSPGPKFIAKLVRLLGDIWMKRAVPQDALIVYIFKRTGDRLMVYDYHLVAVDTKQDLDLHHTKPAVKPYQRHRHITERSMRFSNRSERYRYDTVSCKRSVVDSIAMRTGRCFC